MAESARADAELERQIAADEARVDRQLAAYRARLLPLFAGSYGGTCFQGTTPSKGGLSITPAGMASAGSWRHDLGSSNGTMSMTRALADGKGVSATAMVNNRNPDWTVGVLTGTNETAIMESDGSAIRCENVAEARQLRGQRLYPAVAPLFVAGAGTLSCAVGTDMLRKPVAFAFTASGMTAGPYSFSFEAPTGSEMVSVDASSKVLTYGFEYEDKATLAVSVDLNGKLSDVIISSTKVVMICEHDKQ